MLVRQRKTCVVTDKLIVKRMLWLGVVVQWACCCVHTVGVAHLSHSQMPGVPANAVRAAEA